MSEQPFDSIESAQEFLSLLAAAIDDTVDDLHRDRGNAIEDRQERQLEALDLALYKLKLLDSHIHKSRRILNDLRSIRRLLVNERSAAAFTD